MMFDDLESAEFSAGPRPSFTEQNSDVLNNSRTERRANVTVLRQSDPNLAIRRAVLSGTNEIELEAKLKEIASDFGLKMLVVRKIVKEVKAEQRAREKESAGNKMKPPPLPSWGGNLITNSKGEIKDCLYNLVQIFENHENWAGRIKGNLLTGNTEVNGEQLRDSTLVVAATILGEELRMSANNLPHIRAAMDTVGALHSYHPVIEWLDSLPEWDGTARIDTMFADHLGTEQSPYSAYVARTLLCSMLARVYDPGCIVRTVPILEGPENIGKSRFVRDLAYPWGGEISSNVESGKQIMEDIRGLLLAELMEMDTLRGAAASRIKAFITQRTDRYRKSYGYVSEDHPRITVFVGTINPNQALSQFSDDDQNSRFLPLVVTSYDSDAFMSIREQIFAEAKVVFAFRRHDWWIHTDEEIAPAVLMRDSRTVQDPLTPPILSYLTAREEVTIDGILAMLDIPQKDWNRSFATRVGLILRKAGWSISKHGGSDGRRARVYVKR